MLKSISNNFGIDVPVKTSFSNMKNAKDFFLRHVLAIEGNNSIFMLTYPESCKHLQVTEEEPTNNIRLTFHDIESAFDTTYVNDSMLSFANMCLNFHLFHSKEKNAIPHVVFGDILDTVKLVFSPKFHPEVFDYINLNTDFDNYVEDRDFCTEGMKKWYCSETKHYLRRLIDHYSVKNQKLNSYATIVNIASNHWIYIYVNLFPDNNEEPYVHSIDGMNGSDLYSFHIRRAFAKFFGLYMKETHKKLPLTDYDFDGHDLIDDKKSDNPFKRQKEGVYPSMLCHKPVEPKIYQNDGYNCGLIAFVHCLEAYKKSEKVHTLLQQKQDDFMNEMRLKIMSIASDFWLMFNGDEFDKLKDHLFMEHGETKNKNDVSKWILCHNLFDSGVFTYKQPNNKNNTTANEVYKKYKAKTLQAMYAKEIKFRETSKVTYKDDDELEDSNSDTETENDSDADGTKPIKKARLRKKKNSKKNSNYNDMVDKRDPKNLVMINENDLEMDDFPLCQNPNPRRSIFDVNDQILYLGSKYHLGSKRFYPHDIVKKLLTFFSFTYCVGLSVEDKKIFKEEVTKYMKEYPTYFIMDLMRDKDGNQMYNIIAALILEESVFLNNINFSVIHLLSVRANYEDSPHAKVLLTHVLNTTTIDERPMIFVYQFGKYKFQYIFEEDSDSDDDEDPFYVNPEYTFQKMKFVEYQYECFDNLILPGSRYLYGNGHNIFAPCHKAEVKTETARVCYTHNYVPKMCRYSSSKEYFEIYTHSFLWMDCSIEKLAYIPPRIQKYCKENPDNMIELKGGGHRNVLLSGEVSNESLLWKFRDEFQKNDSRFENCCVWLAAILLIDIDNKAIANHMFELMDHQLSTFEWMFLCKIPQQYKGQNASLLINLLQHKKIRFTLKKVPFKNIEGSYLDHVLSATTTGQYICQLESNGGNKNHVVGIDCNKKAILDGCESHALSLNKDNLDHCCGHYLKGLKRIVYCYELVKN